MAHIDTHKVKSGNIDAIGHDDGVLRVRFKNGGVYDYSGVSANEFDELRRADSIGSHFASRIKGKFDFRKEK